MKLENLYRLGVTIGIENDPRGRDAVDWDLGKSKKAFEALKPEEKDYFDPDTLWNPYSDSRMVAGDPDVEIRGILTGIDIGVAEIILADRLREKGAKIDAVLSHHPSGIGMVGLPKVMLMQADILAGAGVPINIGEDLIYPRHKEVEQAVFAANHYQTADSAKLLGIPLFSLHTPADNCVVTYLTKVINDKAPKTVDDVLKVMKEVPEYDLARRKGLCPKIECGSGEKRAGKIIVEMTGGTTGSKDSWEQLADAGVGTIIVMHIPKDHVEMAQKFHLNIVNVGHMASDSIGMNHILDRFEQNGVEITATSGLIRVNRNPGAPPARSCPMPSSYLQ
jgi:putative NIF3 family GTP cyclohydrolase 1 type 2